MFWSLLNPLILLAVYSLIFGFVFRSRWGGEGVTLDFVLILFAGLIVFNLFSECVVRAPTLLLSHANYIKKVVFPLEIFPFVVLGAALFHTVISIVVWLLLYVFVHGVPHWSAIFVPLIFIPMCLNLLGFVYFLSALGVYMRDIGQIVGLLVQAMLFLSPIFYSVDQAPAALSQVLRWNPLTPVIEQSRSVLFYGNLPDWGALGEATLLSILTLTLGYLWFQKTRDGFSDVI
jgi:lipopolysaccharide transport system permease protein